MAEIRAYLDERRDLAQRGLQRGVFVRAARLVTPYRFRQWVKLNGTAVLLPWWWLKARSVQRAAARNGNALRLNLGSGPRRISGWLNVDLAGMKPDLAWDLRRGVPFPDDSAQAVFLEHFVEHFPLSEVFEILEEARRVLCPGGTIRVGVPDFGRYMESYARDGSFIEQLRPGRPTRLLAVAEVALFHGHRSVWDGTTLARVLTEAGFTNVRVRSFGESTLEPAPDTPMREPESVYAEGQKPGSAAESSASAPPLTG